MDFYAVSALVNAVTSILLGAFVFFRNRRNRTNNAFILLTFAVFIWSLFYFFWQISTDYSSALLLTRLLSIGSVLIPIFYLHWVLSFLGIDNNKQSERVLMFGYGITLVFLFFSFSPYFIEDVERIMFFEYWPKAGILYSLYLLFSYFGLIGYGIMKLLDRYRKTTGLLHYQIKYILMGSFIGFAGGLTNFFLWYGIPILPVGNIIVSLYVFILFYAMMRYRLMDMRIIFRQLFVYVGVSLFTYIFFYLLIIFYDTFFGGVFTFGSYAFGLLVAPLFVLIFYNTSKAIQGFANKYFFVSLYGHQNAINKLAEDLTKCIDLNKIIKLLVATMKSVMNTNTVYIFLEQDGDYYLSGSRKKMVVNDNIIRYLEKKKNLLISDELQYVYEEDGNEGIVLEAYCYMKDKDISIFLPLVINNGLIGFIILGPKESSDPYTKEDIELLLTLSKQASIALENARQYKQIKEFGKMLQIKVDEQVKDIKEKNEYLQELLVMRSDFLKVISHQLNTPLSIIRGYLSMIKEGDYDLEKALPVIEAGLYRIIGTVNDFCEAYKLEGENPRMNYQKVDILSMIDGLVKEKIILNEVKEKKLLISFRKPKKKIPLVWCDLERIRRVTENILDNAIVYTSKGKIEISCSVFNKDYVKISIKDSGCGIPESDKGRIFEKFSRGRKAPLIYQNGSGLGLYIARKIVESNGGEISYSSKGEGKGTVFIFTVPVYREGMDSKK